MKPHVYKDSYVYAEADWSAIVKPGTKIHILHGGTSDAQGVYECAQHLQRVWQAGVVCASNKDQVLAIVRAAEGGANARLIVVISTETIAECPTGYDALLRMGHVTVLVAAALAQTRGRPYSPSAAIVAVILPSCRADMEYVCAAAAVYCFPGAADMLEQSLWSLPHGMALAWPVGSRAPLCVSFLAAGPPLPQQEAVDRLFWWAAPARPVPGLPHTITDVVTTKGSPFYPTQGVVPQRVAADRIRLRSSMDASMLMAARSDPEVCSRRCDFHIVDTDGAVHPCHLVLNACTEEWVRGEEDEDMLFLTGTVTYRKLVAASVAPAPVAWKQYTAALPEV